jgi:hypothetical protein
MNDLSFCLPDESEEKNQESKHRSATAPDPKIAGGRHYHQIEK